MEAKKNLDILASKLRLIGDLTEKLVYVNWNRESFVLLGWIARDIVQIIQDRQGYEDLAKLALRLVHQVNDCLSAEHLPEGQEREHLLTLLEALSHALPRTDAMVQESKDDSLSVSSLEVWLVSAKDSWQLLPELQSAAFRTRHLKNVDETRSLLVETPPMALIVDADFPGENLAGIKMLEQIQPHLSPTMPVFFLAERGDLDARLQAVHAGGTGYFSKPVDAPSLLERLRACLLHESARGYRVTIVAATSGEAQEMAQALEDKQIVTQVVNQPMRVMQALHHFRPNLLLLDLDLIAVNTMDLAKAIRQHEDFEGLPMILLSSQSGLDRHLSALGAGGDDLLGKPLLSDYLLSVVTYRLRRAETLTNKLSDLGHKDTVSGLYNRRHFLSQLDRMLAIDSGRSVTVMLISLDNLRKVETMDVAAADEVVEQAAGRLQSVLTAGHQIARFGDAVFAVLINDADRETVLAVARAVRAALETKTYAAGKESVQLQVSIGISVAEPEECDAPNLIQHADLACSVARENRSEHIHIHHPRADQEVAASHQQRLLEEIEEAVQQQRMGLLFQPIVSMRGDQAERYEVLLRMRNREGRELLPETVFGVAQQHRLGMILDRWVIAQSIRLLRERQARGQSTTLFINISLAILKDNALHAWLKSSLEKSGMLARDLVFEMAESMAAQHMPELCHFLEQVKALGCGFCLERFGEQEYSQGLLKTLPADYVKLDFHFIHNLVNDIDKQQQLTRLAKELATLKITTVVGGIEDPSTLALLWSCGIDYVQGFFLQRPHKEMIYDFASSAF